MVFSRASEKFSWFLCFHNDGWKKNVLHDSSFQQFALSSFLTGWWSVFLSRTDFSLKTYQETRAQGHSSLSLCQSSETNLRRKSASRGEMSIPLSVVYTASEWVIYFISMCWVICLCFRLPSVFQERSLKFSFRSLCTVMHDVWQC